VCYDVRYDDGDRSQGLEAARVRVLAPAGALYAVGARVQGRYADGSWYAATIAAVHPQDKLYDLLYDDGDAGSGLTAAQIRSVPVQSYSRGDAVECYFEAVDRWYPGRVEAFNAADGSYAVNYEDGDEEANVQPQRMRSTAPPAAPPAALHSQGRSIEARYRQGAAWFPGRVQAVKQSAGKWVYDVTYDDGDFEANVAEASTRAVPGQAAAASHAHAGHVGHAGDAAHVHVHVHAATTHHAVTTTNLDSFLDALSDDDDDDDDDGNDGPGLDAGQPITLYGAQQVPARTAGASSAGSGQVDDYDDDFAP
jgi:hypothetical protein